MAFFSSSYADARQKFRKKAKAVGAFLESIPLSNGLEVDVASWGRESKPALIVSSGLHGVEGFFGSAVQLAAMDQLQSGGSISFNIDEFRVVFVHGLNPYGFEHLRRVDENNVDLNRNFLTATQCYRGAPPAYTTLDGFLNPQSPPESFDLYRLKAAACILRYGVPTLKEAIVCGQYRYPQGIFYGGSERAAVAEFVIEQSESWIGGAEQVVHIDLHTGLGKFAEHKILLNEKTTEKDYRWYCETFGEGRLASLQSEDRTAYSVSGGMGVCLKKKYSDRNYYFVGAEFGTYGPVRVVGALRAENRAHYYAQSQSHLWKNAKAELLECFCPGNLRWRSKVIDSSVKIISAAMIGLAKSSR